MLLLVELHIQFYQLLLLAFQRLRQQRMKSLAQEQSIIKRHDRFTSAMLDSPASLCSQHIHIGQILTRSRYRLGIGGQLLGKDCQQAHHFSTLGILQLLEFVIEFYNLNRLDIECTSRRRLILNKTIQFSFIGRRHGYHSPAITNRYHRLGIYDSRFFSI